MTQETVRISDVAQAAGVSPATVSRVLGGSTHRVSAKTRAKVESTARALGYRVNPIARALRLSTTGSVGMVVPSIGNPFFTELVEAVEHQLAAARVNLYLCDARGDIEMEASRLKSLSNGAVDGILSVPLHETLSEPAASAAAARVPLSSWTVR
ncbi:LacI family transcriptional regulator [Tessaracoccus sp. HDW20]|nr:LacI family transcriptional regulator [Tessaracoccus coleopterorum]